MKRPGFFTMSFFVLAFVMAGPLRVRADNITWTNAAGGAFATTTNWNSEAGPVPGATDVAIFNLNETYEVTFAAATTIAGMQLLDGNVTFNPGGNRYRVNSAMVLAQSGATLGLTLLNGELYSNANTVLGGSGTTAATLTVGAGGWLNLLTRKLDLSDNTLAHVNGGTVSGTVYVGAGAGASAELRITNGGLYDSNTATGTTFVGLDEGATGTVLISGAGSQWITGGNVNVGARDATTATTGHLTIEDGGVYMAKRVRTDTSIYFYVGRGGGTGTIAVRGQNSLLDIEMAGATRFGQDNGSTATVLVEDNGKMVIRHFGASSALAVGLSGSSGALTVRSGGHVDVQTSTSIAAGGRLELDGGTLDTARGFTGVAGAVYELTLYDGGFDAPLAQTGASFGTNLGGMTFALKLDGDFDAELNDAFGVLRYAGSLSGTFDGLAEGAILSEGGYQFQLGYGSGSNSEITLTVIPEPGSLGLLLGASALIALARRRRNRG